MCKTRSRSCNIWDAKETKALETVKELLPAADISGQDRQFKSRAQPVKSLMLQMTVVHFVTCGMNKRSQQMLLCWPCCRTCGSWWKCFLIFNIVHNFRNNHCVFVKYFYYLGWSKSTIKLNRCHRVNQCCRTCGSWWKCIILNILHYLSKSYHLFAKYFY